jgi:hypothetical protein
MRRSGSRSASRCRKGDTAIDELLAQGAASHAMVNSKRMLRLKVTLAPRAEARRRRVQVAHRATIDRTEWHARRLRMRAQRTCLTRVPKTLAYHPSRGVTPRRQRNIFGRSQIGVQAKPLRSMWSRRCGRRTTRALSVLGSIFEGRTHCTRPATATTRRPLCLVVARPRQLWRVTRAQEILSQGLTPLRQRQAPSPRIIYRTDNKCARPAHPRRSSQWDCTHALSHLEPGDACLRAAVARLRPEGFGGRARRTSDGACGDLARHTRSLIGHRPRAPGPLRAPRSRAANSRPVIAPCRQQQPERQVVRRCDNARRTNELSHKGMFARARALGRRQDRAAPSSAFASMGASAVGRHAGAELREQHVQLVTSAMVTRVAVQRRGPSGAWFGLRARGALGWSARVERARARRHSRIWPISG